MLRIRSLLVTAIVVTGLVAGALPAAATTRYLGDPTFSVKVTKRVPFGNNHDFVLNADGSCSTGGPIQQLYMDVYSPIGDTVTDRPAIVWAHGGGFLVGGRGGDSSAAYGNAFAGRGYVFVSIDYRMCEHGPKINYEDGLSEIETARIAAASSDQKTAIRFLRRHATSFGIDTNRIAVGGNSAGAITSLTTSATKDELYDGDDNLGYPQNVCTAVSVAGATDPLLIDSGDAGAIFFHGLKDTVVLPQHMYDTRDALDAAGLPWEVHTYDYRHTINQNLKIRTDMIANMVPWLFNHLVTCG